MLFLIVSSFAFSSVICQGAVYSLNRRDTEGNTPIHLVARSGEYISMLDSLARVEGLDFNMQNNNGNTPLHEAVLAKKHEQKMIFILYLLTRGADISIKNNNGLDPLELALEVDLDVHHFLSFFLKNRSIFLSKMKE
jgi:ankyrin repeat protein